MARAGMYALTVVLPLLPESRTLHAVICYLVLPAALLLSLFGRRPPTAQLRPLCRLLPFVFLCGISLLVSPYRPAGWPAFGMLLAHAGGAAAAALSLNKKEQVARLLQFATASGALVAGIGIAQYYGWQLPGWTVQFPGRITATFANPNHLGSYLACLLPPAYVLVAAALRPVPRVAWGLAAVLIYTALFLSASRGAWWAAFLTLVGLGFGLWRADLTPEIRRARVALGSIVGIWGLITAGYSMPTPLRMPHAASLSQRLTETGDLLSPQVVGQTSVGHRRLIWKTALDIVRDHPFIGTGYGTYGRIYPAYRDRRLAGDPAFKKLSPVMQAENTRYAHNEYLQICAESGVLALLAFLFGIAPVFRLPFDRGPRTVSPSLHPLGLWGILAVLLLHSLVSYPLRLPLHGFLFWTALGLFTSPALRGRSHGPPPYPVRLSSPPLS